MPLSTSVISIFITSIIIMEKVSTRSALSDTEKREKKIVEKKLMEMEEELKVISILVMLTVVVMLKLVEMEERMIILMTDNMTMLSERATMTIMIVYQLE